MSILLRTPGVLPSANDSGRPRRLVGGHGAAQNWVIGAPNPGTIHSSAPAQSRRSGALQGAPNDATERRRLEDRRAHGDFDEESETVVVYPVD
jgi:hypothetical protein